MTRSDKVSIFKSMETIKGISASPGVYIGKVFLYYEENMNIPKYQIEKREVEQEYSRFLDAVEKARNEIETIKEIADKSMGEKEIILLDSHILMLSDPEFMTQISNALKQDLINVEWALFDVIENIIKKLKSSENDYFNERASDLKDVSKRVLNNLMFMDRLNLSNLEHKYIIAAHDLLPSDAITMDKKKVKGLILDAGGKTSHTAIIARSFEIPAVVGLSDITKRVKNGENVIVDGDSGVVVIDPDEQTMSEYRERIEQIKETDLQLKPYFKKEAVTTDGKKIIIKANIEVPEEIHSVMSHGSDGIGLFRSEFLLLQSEYHKDEEKQFEVYKTVLTEMKGKPVTIRTLDIGGDKTLPGFEEHKEKNPLLGWRGIRFCLTNNTTFKRQLRALYRASIYGDLRIMFPMISGAEELEIVLGLIEEVKTDLRKENIEFADKTPLGIMIEVPSAVLSADFLAKKVDFFSIGTNDLIQYAIAIDRGNEKIAYLYQPSHPAIIRLIKMTCEAGKNAGIPVGICGEMGGDPLATVVLLGLGIDEMSMSVSSIPVVKKIIRSVSVKEAEDLVSEIMKIGSGTEIIKYIEKWYNERFNTRKNQKIT